jgi:hypothetical protein
MNIKIEITATKLGTVAVEALVDEQQVILIHSGQVHSSISLPVNLTKAKAIVTAQAKAIETYEAQMAAPRSV